MAAFAELKAVLGLDVSPFKRGMDGAKKEAKTFASDFGSTIKGAMASLGVGFGAGALISFTRDVARELGDISDAADRIGISTQSWQALRFQAEKFGVEMGTVEQALYRLKTVQGDVLGSDGLQGAFEALGVSIFDVRSLDVDDLFTRIGEAMRNAKDQQSAYNAVGEIFGTRIGPRMVALLKETAPGMSSISKEAYDAGQVVEDELIAKADKFDLAWTRAIRAVKIGYAEMFSGGTDDDSIGEAEAKAKARADAQAMADKRKKGKEESEAVKRKKADEKQHEVLAKEEKAWDKAIEKERQDRAEARRREAERKRKEEERQRKLEEDRERKLERERKRKKRIDKLQFRIDALYGGAPSPLTGGVTADSMARMGAQIGGDNRGGAVDRAVNVLNEIRDLQRRLVEINEETQQ